jgi:hypothetical protein
MAATPRNASFDLVARARKHRGIGTSLTVFASPDVQHEETECQETFSLVRFRDTGLDSENRRDTYNHGIAPTLLATVAAGTPLIGQTKVSGTVVFRS